MDFVVGGQASAKQESPDENKEFGDPGRRWLETQDGIGLVTTLTYVKKLENITLDLTFRKQKSITKYSYLE